MFPFTAVHARWVSDHNELADAGLPRATFSATRMTKNKQMKSMIMHHDIYKLSKSGENQWRFLNNKAKTKNQMNKEKVNLKRSYILRTISISDKLSQHLTIVFFYTTLI